MIVNWIPAVFLALFISVGFGWRMWLQRRRFGHSGLVLFRSGRWGQHLREASLFAVAVLLGVQVVAAGTAPGRVARLAPLAALGAAGYALGLLLAFGGLALMVRAQLEMGASWRIGVDEGSRPGLVTHGLYAWTRNPIYLAMCLAFGGLLLLLPTWITLIALVGTVLGIQRQVREEEAYLLRTYGDEFRRYAARVGRFVPGLGRSVG
jgi:protein-S-isoprenylcysteine O-methyltransferase Ste14